MINWTEKTVRVDSLKPYEKNPRQITEGQYQKLKKSIQENGYFQRVLTQPDCSVIGGHSRLRVFKELGTEEIKILVPDRQLSQEEFKRILVQDNLSFGEFDTELLKEDFTRQEMLAWGAPPELVGEFDRTANGRTVDPDAVPPPPKEPITKVGDVWKLGDHRLICGDAGNPEVVKKLLTEDIDCILTDPPYCSGGFQEAGKSSGSIGTRQQAQIANDKLSTRGYMALMKGVLQNAPAPHAYIFTDWRMWINLYDVAEANGFGVRSMIVWNKGTPGMGRGWRMQHEIILFGARNPVPFPPECAQGNVITCKRQANELHPTQKPVELIETLLNVSAMSKIIYDPFAGSGTTAIACENLGRKARMVEMSTAYCDVIVERWQAYTGKTAERE